MAQLSNNIYLGATDGMGFPNLPTPGAGGSDDSGLIAYEQKTLTADKAYTTGDNFVYDGVIYVATANIAKDATIVIEGAGANAEALDPVQKQINALAGPSVVGLIAYEQKTLTADKAYTVGDNFVYDGVIYVVTSNIAKDATIVIEGAGANAEALDPVQTQINALSGSSGGINYSTTEQNTGLKWIDGKDIYQKTFSFTTTRTGQSTVVPDSTIANLSDVVSTDIMFNLSDVALIANNYYTAASNYFTAYYNKNTGIDYTVSANVSCYFTIRYTKSTT